MQLSSSCLLQPEDERFEEISALYYKELTKLYGKTGFYAIDPFHEGGSTQGVNLDAAGKAIMKAMKKQIRMLCGWLRHGKTTLVLR